MNKIIKELELRVGVKSWSWIERMKLRGRFIGEATILSQYINAF